VIGLVALRRGRQWHDLAAGPSFPSIRFGPLSVLLRNKAGRIAVTALPIQVFGAITVLVAVMILAAISSAA
jgi:hypothetical protein